MKPIQVIKAWRFPCDKNIFEMGNDASKLHKNLQIVVDYLPSKTRKTLLIDDCPCGKNCKPQKIKITVEVE